LHISSSTILLASKWTETVVEESQSLLLVSKSSELRCLSSSWG
jgi:hypothetical protein